MYDPLGIRCLNERLIRHSSGIFVHILLLSLSPAKAWGLFLSIPNYILKRLTA